MSKANRTCRLMPRQTGVTLIELIVVLAIAAIIALIGAPSLTTIIKDSRLRLGANGLQNSMALARSTAVARSSRVTICKSSDGTSCATSGDWSQGWMIFEDTGTIGDSTDDTTVDGNGDQRVRVKQGLDVLVTIVGSAGIESFVSFDGSGFTRDASNNYQSGTFTVCDDRGDAGRARAVYLGAAGSSRVGDLAGGLTCDG
ncbi:prepilin-type N-terminal cleavage/methylation domain-containing protein [Aequoribacter fuscus]|nr:GspH/FimT family protein [Aequoribacter fuscus]QHJ88592.1 prepilin-type N-terminal cleavage/methylation domain-containing protein [Aequoribacter fuscus]